MSKKKSHDEEPAVMSAGDFKRWRKHLNLSQKEAAQALGLKRRILQYYEKGERNGDPVAIPKTVRLACFAITQGCNDYRGPEESTTGGPDDASGVPVSPAMKSAEAG